jgi:hypothetical protein
MLLRKRERQQMMRDLILLAAVHLLERAALRTQMDFRSHSAGRPPVVGRAARNTQFVAAAAMHAGSAAKCLRARSQGKIGAELESRLYKTILFVLLPPDRTRRATPNRALRHAAAQNPTPNRFRRRRREAFLHFLARSLGAKANKIHTNASPGKQNEKAEGHTGAYEQKMLFPIGFATNANNWNIYHGQLEHFGFVCSNFLLCTFKIC